ncbi:hypothetical protein [Pyrococcus abyssi]|nr:hypothetical protein [Pyrococcus abyssi]CCE71072.1 TPA: hypothetical protein PAB1290 [Pyrococcus abyssi GE5]
MKRELILVVFVSILLIPIAHAQVSTFPVNGEIICLVNSTTSGEFGLINELPVDFTYVSVREIKVLDKNRNEVSGISVKLLDLIIRDWKAKDSKSIRYLAMASSNVTPGDYTLYIFMWGFTKDKMYLIRAYVPIKVSDKPLIFKDAVSFVKERPFSDVALAGDTIVVYSHVINIASTPINVTAEALLKDPLGNVIVKLKRTLSLLPGDNIIRFELQIPLNASDGRYELNYIINYERGSYEYSKDYLVEFGVRLESFSLERTNVLEGEDNFAYIGITSDRSVDVNLTVEVYNDVLGLVYSNRSEVLIRDGPNMLKIDLPTTYPGKNTVNVRILFNGRLLGEKGGWYLVIGYPKLNVTLENKNLVITVENPNNFNIMTELGYRVEWSNGRIMKDVFSLNLDPGVRRLIIRLNGTGEFKYKVTLEAFGRLKTINGSGVVRAEPEPETEIVSKNMTSTTSKPSGTSTMSPTQSTTSKTSPAIRGNKGNTTLILAVVLGSLIIFILGLSYYYYTTNQKRRRRKRPKPRRRSPLGRVR